MSFWSASELGPLPRVYARVLAALPSAEVDRRDPARWHRPRLRRSSGRVVRALACLCEELEHCSAPLSPLLGLVVPLSAPVVQGFERLETLVLPLRAFPRLDLGSGAVVKPSKNQDGEPSHGHQREPSPAVGVLQFEMTVNFLNGSLNVHTDRVPLGKDAMSPAFSSTRSPVAASSMLTEPSKT
jgi:hypothetical protein